LAQALNPPNLEERVIACDHGVINVFSELDRRVGRKRAAEIAGLTPRQFYRLLKEKDIRFALHDSYVAACGFLGMNPADTPVVTRTRQPTSEEREKYYVILTREMRASVRRAISGRTIGEVSLTTGISHTTLTYLADPDSKIPKYTPEAWLEAILGSAGNTQRVVTGADAHPRHKYVGYRRMGDEEKRVMRMFLMGSSRGDASQIFSVFWHDYKPEYFKRWFTGLIRYVNDFDYNLMAAIVRLRESSGYYDIISDSRLYEWQPLHIRNTLSRRQALEKYSIRFGYLGIDGYAKAANGLGIDALLFERIVQGMYKYVPAWMHVRVLESSLSSGRLAGLAEEDKGLAPFIGLSGELEKRLNDYSLSSLRQSFVSDLSAIATYAEQPESSAYALLQAVQRGYANQSMIRELRMAAQHFAEPRILVAAVIAALGRSNANQDVGPEGNDRGEYAWMGETINALVLESRLKGITVEMAIKQCKQWGFDFEKIVRLLNALDNTPGISNVGMSYSRDMRDKIYGFSISAEYRYGLTADEFFGGVEQKTGIRFSGHGNYHYSRRDTEGDRIYALAHVWTSGYGTNEVLVTVNLPQSRLTQPPSQSPSS